MRSSVSGEDAGIQPRFANRVPSADVCWGVTTRRRWISSAMPIG